MTTQPSSTLAALHGVGQQPRQDMPADVTGGPDEQQPQLAWGGGRPAGAINVTPGAVICHTAQRSEYL